MHLPTTPDHKFYESQGLRLHYIDWGNAAAPPLLLVHGGLDHCRNWDVIARALQPHFHIIAPDLRGHGDSDWAKGSSYSLSDYVHDLTGLMRIETCGSATIIGHSMGGMVSLIYTGAFPDKVSALAVLDGVTVSPTAQKKPVHERIATWTDQLDAIAARSFTRFRNIDEAARRLSLRNTRLTPEQALHLAEHAVRPTSDGGYVWKFDPHQRAAAPYRLWPDDHVALWQRITCPTLLLRGGDSFLPDPALMEPLTRLPNWRMQTVDGCGHWLHHEKPDEVLTRLRAFLKLANPA